MKLFGEYLYDESGLDVLSADEFPEVLRELVDNLEGFEEC